MTEKKEQNIEYKNYAGYFSALGYKERILFLIVSEGKPLSAADLIDSLKLDNKMTVYRTIDKLLQEGMIELHHEDTIEGATKPTSFYIATERGKTIIDNRIKELEERKRVELEEEKKLGVADYIEIMQEFLEDNHLEDMQNDTIQGKKSLQVDFSELAKKNKDMANMLIDDPDNILKAGEEAMKSLGFKFHLEIINLPKSQRINIRDKKAEHLGRLISFEGIAFERDKTKAEAISGKYECPSCGNILNKVYTEGRLKEPTRCSCGRKGYFRLISKELVDRKLYLLKECPGCTEGMPADEILLYVRSPLVEPEIVKRINFSQKLIVNGILRETLVYTKHGSVSSTFNWTLDVNSFEFPEPDLTNLKFSKEEIKQFKQHSDSGSIFKDFIQSLAPGIHGYEDIKEALILQAFSSVKGRKRHTIHIALIGDPGIAKTDLIDAAIKQTPLSIFISSENLSTAGLTVAFIRDEYTGHYIAEPGPMVLANGGILGIDEIDRENKDVIKQLNTPMETMEVKAAKAGINVRYPAETSLLIAANPINGHFDMSLPLIPQAALPAALRNRFDMMFFVHDKAEKERDRTISKKMFQRNSKISEPKLDLEYRRKFIAYAKTISPEWPEKLIDICTDFYTEVREQTKETKLVNPRTNGYILRLAEASARVRLSKRIEFEDVERAIRLVCSSFEAQCPYIPSSSLNSTKDNFNFDYKKFMEQHK